MASPEDTALIALEAERAVTCALFSSDGAAAYSEVSLHLTADDFGSAAHRLTFEACAALAARGEAVTNVAVSTYLKASASWKEEYVAELQLAVGGVVLIDHVADFASAIKEKAVARRIRARLGEIADKSLRVGSDVTAEDLLAEIDSITLNVEAKASHVRLLDGPGAMQLEMAERWEAIQAGVSIGAKYPLDGLTSRLGAAENGQLIIIAGRPSMGKSVLAMNFALENAIEGVESLSIGSIASGAMANEEDGPLIAVFSLEMDRAQLGNRTLSAMTAIEYQKVKQGDFTEQEWDRVKLAWERMHRSSLHIDDDGFLTPARMRAKLRQLEQRTKKRVAVVIVDYLQLMSGDSRRAETNRTLEVGEITRGLKAIAKEFMCPVVALSQLSRDLEKRADKRPVMADLRESGAIEQDADVILFVYRDEVYNPDSMSRGMAEIIIGKARDAVLGMVPAVSELQFQRFVDTSANAYSYENLTGRG